MESKTTTRTCDKHPGRALYREVKGTAMCAECFNQRPVKERDFEPAPAASFPETQKAMVRRAIEYLKMASPEMCVKIPTNGRRTGRVSVQAHETAHRLGFEVETRSDRGLWVYVRRKAGPPRRLPVPIRKERSA